MPPPTYRPYLSASELSTILSALKSLPLERNIKLIRKLETYQWKIQAEHLAPSYQPAPTMAERLELDDSPQPRTLEEIRREAYRKYLQNTDSCTAAEMVRAQEYMFENDLMSPEQEAMFLSSQEGK